jgi:hypothetical protein
MSTEAAFRNGQNLAAQKKPLPPSTPQTPAPVRAAQITGYNSGKK